MNPEDVYELFNVYATWTTAGAGTTHKRGGLPFGSLKLLLKEADLLEGVPGQLVDAYVHQMMRRADQDMDGLLSCQEFLVLLFSELSALLPFKHEGSPHHPVAPLYNRYVYYAQQYRPDAAYRKVGGMWSGSFSNMCKDLGWSVDARMMLRTGAFLASKASTAARTHGKMEGGSRLQFVQFVQALQGVGERMRQSFDAVIFRVVGNGIPPPQLRSTGSNAAYRKAITQGHGSSPGILDRLFEGNGDERLSGRMEVCHICGKEHWVWISRGIPLPGVENKADPRLRQRMNVRNVRAVFHRYNAACNKGPLPPSSPDTPPDSDTESTAGNGEGVEEDPWGKTGFPACHCCYRQLSLMEWPTFWQLVIDNKFLWDQLQPRSRSDGLPYNPLTSKRVEEAFLATCSVDGGVYCHDASLGVHDKPLSMGRDGVRPSSAQLTAAAASTKRLGAPMSATLAASRTAMLRSSLSLPSTCGSGELLGPASPSGPGVAAGAWQHRTAVPRLSFPQFLEALRLLAEDIKGHPHTLRVPVHPIQHAPPAVVEGNLVYILCGVVEQSCPHKPYQSHAWQLPAPVHAVQQSLAPHGGLRV